MPFTEQGFKGWYVGALTDAEKDALRKAGPGDVIPLQLNSIKHILGQFNANAHKTPRQTKLEAAKAYLKERAAAHPEWKVEKV